MKNNDDIRIEIPRQARDDRGRVFRQARGDGSEGYIPFVSP